MIDAQDLASYLYNNQDAFVDYRGEIFVRDLGDAIQAYLDQHKEARLIPAILKNAG